MKVGGTTIFPTATLSSSTDVTNGKQYTLTLSDFTKEGIVSIVIGTNTLTDTSNNKNVETNLTTSIKVYENLASAIKSKASSKTNINNATSSELHQPFTRKHSSKDSDDEYRYMGTTPYNYINFSGEKWRIIGVFNVEDEKKTKDWN